IGIASFVLGESGAQMNISGLELESLAVEERVAQFDLTLMMAEADGSLSASLQYNSDLFDAARISRMIGHFQTLLESIVTAPQESIGHLPLMTKAEINMMLNEWNDTNVDYSQNNCIHQLFEAQVLKTPDAIALEFEGNGLSYRELNRRANKLAHYLRSLG